MRFLREMPLAEVVSGLPHGHGARNEYDALTKQRDGLLDLVNEFGDSVTDMFEQMTRGSWIDDHGHSVLSNTQMLALQKVVTKAMLMLADAAIDLAEQSND